MKKIYCEAIREDYIKVNVIDKVVSILIAGGDELQSVNLSPDKIHKLRKQLKKALLQIEGVKEDEA